MYINLVMQPIRRLTNFTQQFEQGMNGFARFHEIMQEKPEILGGDKILSSARGDISIKDVTFFYNENENVLKDVSLDIAHALQLLLSALQAAARRRYAISYPVSTMLRKVV